MPVRHEADYWVGNLAMTVALAAVDPDPKPILRSAWRQFVASRPAGDPLVAKIKREMKP